MSQAAIGAEGGSVQSVAQLVESLGGAGIRLWLDGEKLRFDAPRGAMTPSLRDTLRERRQELISFLACAGEPPPIPRADRTAPLSLSFAESRLWMLDRIDGASGVYNVPNVVLMDGALDVSAFTRAFTELTRRHESLRTRFIEVDGEARREILDPEPFTFETMSLETLDVAAQKAELDAIIAREKARPFDLAHGRFVRGTLVRLAPERHALLVTLHHIAFDGWSSDVLLRELSALYRSFVSGRAPSLPEPSIQYADFAQWQRQWLRGEALSQQVAYWKKRLDRVPGALELPTDFARPTAPTYRGDAHRFEIAARRTQQLTALGREADATPFMVLLAAFAVLLSKNARQEDICIGSPIANRHHAGTEGIIGFFVNTLVYRVAARGSLSFRQLLAEVRALALDAYAHQDVPFEHLVEVLRPNRAAGHSPFFQVMFAFHNARTETLQLEGIAFEALPLPAAFAKFDLTLDVEEVGRALQCTFEYSTDLFETRTIQRLSQQFLSLLEVLVLRPDARLQDVSVLTADERRVLLSEWARPEADEGAFTPLAELFEAQVARTPDAIALVAGDCQLTYRELDARSSRLARRLRALGAGRDVLVGILLERSVELLVSLFAVLKSGAAYLPLDPAYPAERLAFMIDDSAVPMVITEPRLADRLAGRSRHVFVDDADADSAMDASSEAHRSSHPGDLVYVIHTSGSTGKPKGVMITQGALSNYVRGLARSLAMTSEDRVLQFISVSFDMAVEANFPPLIVGATLVLADPGVEYDAAHLVRTMAEQDITLISIVPSMLNAVVNEPGLDGCRALRTISAGGEALSTELAERVLARLPGVRLVNAYGPTEVTVDAAHWLVETGERRGLEPIGRPVECTWLYVLDDDLHLVPVGVTGELYVGGRNLARGYLNRPELTAERFVPNPFGAGERLYKTGDVCRWRWDGVLEFLGRIDSQVKVRGFRIELGEVESMLSEHALVREVVAVVQDAPDGAKRLVAYVLAHEAAAQVEGHELRPWLAARLPAYMIPSKVVVLAELPHTPNGKIDRSALSRRDEGDEVGTAEPTTRTEIAVAAIWRDVLKVERVFADDDFFMRGGHSLLATRVVSRVRETFSVEIAGRALFEAPVLRAYAARVDASLGTVPGEGLAGVILAGPYEGDAPLSFAQLRLWFLDRLEGPQATYNVTTAVRLRGPLDECALSASLVEISRRHEVLRTTFVEVDGEPRQRIGDDAGFPLARVDLRGPSPHADAQSEVAAILRREAEQPFDLARGPLARATLVRVRDEESVLVIVYHHIVFDGWSSSLAGEELSALYRTYRRGEPPDLPPMAIQYADFARWQRATLTPERLAGAIAMWRDMLEGAPPRLDLPARSRDSAPSQRGGYREIRLDGRLTDELRRLSLEAHATLYMTLLAAFATLLARYSGQTDIVVGSPLANRNRRETERLIGFFVNTLPIRIDLSDDPAFSDLLARVRATCLRVYANEDTPFEQIVEAVRPERSRNHAPIYQVVFGLQNTPKEELHLDAVELLPEPVDVATAKFDLVLLMHEEGRELYGRLQYDASRFDDVTMQGLLASFETLLRRLAEAPSSRVLGVPLMDDATFEKVVRAGADTVVDHGDPRSIPELFDACVRAHPNALAVVSENDTLTYADLRARARSIARRLRARGVGPGDLVGLCGPRSTEMTAALFGIVLVGAGYLPLDPGYPRERLAYMVTNARAAALLLHSSVAGLFPHYDGIVEHMDAAPFDEAPFDTRVPRPDDVLYAIYTSGSTGTPKGVLGVHAGALNRFRWMWRAFPFEAGEVMCQKTSLGFLDSLWEIFGPILQGVTLHLIADDVVRDPLRLVERLSALRVTRIVLVPSLLRAMLDAVPDLGVRLPRLKYWFSSGEALRADVARSFASNAPGAVLVNLYGSSEVSADVTCEVVRGDAETDGVPLGKPIDNTQVYVLDGDLRPVPPGAVGMIFVGGAALAHGYAHDPSLTAECFVPNPFGRRGERLYRTGDLGRLGSGDAIEYAGRAGQQLKVRGYRIEPKEVESAIVSHTPAREAVVLAEDDGLTGQRLVAHVVPRAGAALAAADVRRAVAGHLPEFMVPSRVVVHAALPTTPSGKIDRKVVASLPELGARTDVSVTVPRDTLELELVRIWQSLLPRSSIGMRDSFFDLGGHSLLAVRLLGRVATAFGVQLPLGSLFGEAASIEGMARLLRASQPPRESSALVTIQQGAADAPPVFCIHPVGGTVLCYVELARALGADWPVYGIQARGLAASEVPSTSIEEMSERYAEAILSRPRDAGQTGTTCHVVGWSFGGNVAIEVAHRLEARGQDVGVVALIDTFNAAAGTSSASRPMPRTDAELLLELLGADTASLETIRAANPLRALTADEELLAVVSHERERDALPPDIDVAEIRRLLEITKAHASIEYTPRGPDEGRGRVARHETVLFYATESPLGDREHQADAWRRALGVRVDVRELPANHHTILQPPHVDVVAADLRRRFR